MLLKSKFKSMNSVCAVISIVKYRFTAYANAMIVPDDCFTWTYKSENLTSIVTYPYKVLGKCYSYQFYNHNEEKILHQKVLVYSNKDAFQR